MVTSVGRRFAWLYVCFRDVYRTNWQILEIILVTQSLRKVFFEK